MSNARPPWCPYVDDMLTEPHQTDRDVFDDIVEGESMTNRPMELTSTVSSIRSRARCSDGNGTLAHLFFSDEDIDVARAKAICRTCTLSESCLQGALDRQEAYGVWGGVLLIDGEPVRFARRRGRPPLHRIEFVADEVPIPDHLVA